MYFVWYLPYEYFECISYDIYHTNILSGQKTIVVLFFSNIKINLQQIYQNGKNTK